MIRRKTKKDMDRIYQLICEMEEKTLPYDSFCMIYQRQLADPLYEGLVYEKEGLVIGVLHLRLEQQLHHCERIAEIMELVIAKEHRRKGYGKELLHAGIAFAKQQGCAQLELSSNKKRIDAHRFYLREGLNSSHFKFSLRLIKESKDKA